MTRPKETDKYRHCNHHHELTDEHKLVDFGDGEFVANKKAIPLLKALNELGLRTRSHHVDDNGGFVAILLSDNITAKIRNSVHEHHSTRTKYNGKPELLIQWHSMDTHVEGELDFILNATDLFPREDVLYEASNRLTKLLTHHGLKLSDFDYNESPVRFAVLLRAIGYSALISAVPDEWLTVVEKGIQHRDAEVRDAAVSALYDIGDKRSLSLLRTALLTEPLPFIRESIKDAVEWFEDKDKPCQHTNSHKNY